MNNFRNEFSVSESQKRDSQQSFNQQSSTINQQELSNPSQEQQQNGKTGLSQQRGSYVPPHLRRGSHEPVRTLWSSQNGVESERASISYGQRRSYNDRGDRYERPQSSYSRDRDASNFKDNRHEYGRQDFRGSDRFNRPNSKQPSMQRDMRVEAELFGTAAAKPVTHELKNYEEIPVEVSGLDVPKPIENFADLDCHEVLKSNIELSGYSHPTPVQRNGIPIALAKRDLMACAQTGSGKTASFLIPMVASILRDGLNLRPIPQSLTRRVARSVAYPSGLVLAPTRELATQIYNESRKFTYRTGIYPVVVYGGADIKQQLREVERGCDLVIATPGRLVDFFERGRMSLSMCEFLVFDEADRMLDMGFEPQIRQIVQNSDMNQDRQTLMFSATFPKEIQRLAQDFLQNYVFLAVGRVGSTTDFITQKVEYAGSGGDNEKIDKLMQILAQAEGLTLIFVETKRGADYLEDMLIREGIEATSIHGDRSQQERENALQMFRIGRCPVLVATDVASRGLDIPDVRMVINYDLPNNIDDYVHRIGRTGRAGKKGTAIAFINDTHSQRNSRGTNGILRDVYDLMKENNQELPDWFTKMATSSGSSYGGSRGYGGGSRNNSSGARGRGGNKSMFASRDYRQDFNNNSYQQPQQQNHQQRPSRGGFGGGTFGQQPAFSQYRGSRQHNDAW